jgi:hypothetical protein
MAHEVRSIPTLAFIRQGKVSETLVGLVERALLAAFVERNLPGLAPPKRHEGGQG